MMMTKMNRLSTDRLYSVTHPAKNCTANGRPWKYHVQIPKHTARPQYADNPRADRHIVGSPDRRAITRTSNSRTAVVAARVTIHSSRETCIGIPPVVDNQRSLPPSVRRP